MRRLGTFLFGMVVGAALLYGLLQYHIVNADDGLHLVPKVNSQLAGTYVDVRNFGVAEWAQHADLALALEKAGRRDLLRAAADDALQRGLDRLLTPEERNSRR
jgi:hypothetical protein